MCLYGHIYVLYIQIGTICIFDFVCMFQCTQCIFLYFCIGISECISLCVNLCKGCDFIQEKVIFLPISVPLKEASYNIAFIQSMNCMMIIRIHSDF